MTVPPVARDLPESDRTLFIDIAVSNALKPDACPKLRQPTESSASLGPPDAVLTRKAFRPHAGGSPKPDSRRRARQPRTYMRPSGCARNSGFPSSDRCESACWPKRRCPTGTAHGPRAQWCIRLHAEAWARPAQKLEPTAATKGTESLTERRAQELGPAQEPEQKSPRTQRRSLGASGIAPETVASSGRQSSPPPWRLSTGSRTVS